MSNLQKSLLALAVFSLVSTTASSDVLTFAECRLVTMSNLSEDKVFNLELVSGSGLQEKVIDISRSEKLKIELRDKSQSTIRYTENVVTISFIRNDVAGFSSSGESYVNLNGIFNRGQDRFNLTCSKNK